MTSEVLWRRLSSTDFRAMSGHASPHGNGGGAMHIALGVSSSRFPIERFLELKHENEKTIFAYADREGKLGANLSFSGNPSRRGGEWTIRDQYSNRHPAWRKGSGFPLVYDPLDPIYILIFKIGRRYYARFILESILKSVSISIIPKGIFASTVGVSLAGLLFLDFLNIPHITLFEEAVDSIKDADDDVFDPANLADGRERIIGSLFRRLGQRSFRKKLIFAYESQCAITACKFSWVLEAAHIFPYRGVNTNAATNGILLRADIHTLFDLSLISINPGTMKIRTSSVLAGTDYESFDGKIPFLPRKANLRPSTAALDYHFRRFHA